MGDIHGCSTSILSFPVASFLLKVLISGNFSLTAGAFDQISSMLVRAKESQSVVQQNSLKPIVQKRHNGQSSQKKFMFTTFLLFLLENALRVIKFLCI